MNYISKKKNSINRVLLLLSYDLNQACRYADNLQMVKEKNCKEMYPLSIKLIKQVFDGNAKHSRSCCWDTGQQLNYITTYS